MCAALGAAGLLVGLAISPGVVAVVALVGAIGGAAGAFALWSLTRPKPSRRRASFVLRGAALTGLAPPAAVGLAVAMGANFWGWALLMWLSSPPLLGKYSRWLGSASQPKAVQLWAALSVAVWVPAYYVRGPPVDTAGELQRLTDEALCQRWWSSCLRMSVHPPSDAVQERQELLEEMERRNPSGYWAWITSDAPRPATLMRHLSSASASRDPVDWDTLLR
jgi:hypothetical protein